MHDIKTRNENDFILILCFTQTHLPMTKASSVWTDVCYFILGSRHSGSGEVECMSVEETCIHAIGRESEVIMQNENR